MSVKSKNNADSVSDVVAYKTAKASKLSLRSEGLLTYQLGFVESVNQLFVCIQANDTGGYFSKEWVPLDAVLSCLKPVIDAKSSLTASLLKSAFVSKSQNNAGFLAAILKAEGLLVCVVGKSNLLSVKAGFLDQWLIDNKEQAVSFLAGSSGGQSSHAPTADSNVDASASKPVTKTVSKRKILSKSKVRKAADTAEVEAKSTGSVSDLDEDAVIDQLATD